MRSHNGAEHKYSLGKKDVMTWGISVILLVGNSTCVFSEEADRHRLKQVVTIKAQQDGKGAVGCAS